MNALIQGCSRKRFPADAVLRWFAVSLLAVPVLGLSQAGRAQEDAADGWRFDLDATGRYPIAVSKEAYYAFQAMLDDFADRCRAGEFPDGPMCITLRFAWMGGYDPGVPTLSLFLFELNYDETKKALQDIRAGD